MFGINLVDPYGGMTVDWLGGASVTLVVSLVTRLLVGLGWFKMFEKAGKPGWYGFVPLLGEYTAFRMTWDDFSMSAIFAATTFVAWISSLGVDAPIVMACAWINLVLWWLYCLITAVVAFKSSIIWGVLYGAVPWGGALLLGWMPTFRYYGPWSSDPNAEQNLSKKERKKRAKQNAQK